MPKRLIRNGLDPSQWAAPPIPKSKMDEFLLPKIYLGTIFHKRYEQVERKLICRLGQD